MRQSLSNTQRQFHRPLSDLTTTNDELMAVVELTCSTEHLGMTLRLVTSRSTTMQVDGLTGPSHLNWHRPSRSFKRRFKRRVWPATPSDYNAWSGLYLPGIVGALQCVF